MKQNLIVLLILHLVTVCTAFYASPMVRLSVEASDPSTSIKELAQVLNVSVPGKILVYYCDHRL